MAIVIVMAACGGLCGPVNAQSAVSALSVTAPCDSPPSVPGAAPGSGTVTRIRGNLCRYQMPARAARSDSALETVGRVVEALGGIGATGGIGAGPQAGYAPGYGYGYGYGNGYGSGYGYGSPQPYAGTFPDAWRRTYTDPRLRPRKDRLQTVRDVAGVLEVVGALQRGR